MPALSNIPPHASELVPVATWQRQWEEPILLTGFMQLESGHISLLSQRSSGAVLRSNPGAGNPWQRMHGGEQLWLDTCRRAQETGQPVRFETEDSQSASGVCLSTTIQFIGEYERRSRFMFSVEDISGRSRQLALLRQKTQELEHLNAHLQNFVHAVSHDLLGPVRNVATFAEVLATRYADSLDADGHRFLGFIEAGAKRVDALLRDLLTYSLLSAEQLPPGRPHSNCSEALNKVLLTLEASLTNSGTTVHWNNLPEVAVREVHVVQLFHNLIENAIKYKRHDLPQQIEVSAEAGEGCWLFRVRDSGIGIEPEHQSRVFQPFKRLQPAICAGTGIGLAICQRIVQMYDGTIRVESGGTGQGSTFVFSFPAAEPKLD